MHRCDLLYNIMLSVNRGGRTDSYMLVSICYSVTTTGFPHTCTHEEGDAECMSGIARKDIEDVFDVGSDGQRKHTT